MGMPSRWKRFLESIWKAAVNKPREIGGYYEFERYRGALPHEAALALNCGRGCLLYEIEAYGIKRILLPDYLCDSVAAACKGAGVSVGFYSVGVDFLPAWDFDVAEDQWLYLVDYFGQLSDASVDQAKKIAGERLIVDETQGFFQKPREGVDTLYTTRKYFGVSDGGFLYTDARVDRILEQDESHARMSYLLGRFERPASEFYSEASENNDFFATEPAKRMSLLTENILRSLDYPAIVESRERNYRVLETLVGERNSLDISMPPGPFAYPLLVADGPTARSALAKQGIYVPTLWPNVVESGRVGSAAYEFSRNIMPLPVDQRYQEDDMALIAQALRDEGVL